MDATFTLDIDHTLYVGAGGGNPFNRAGEVRLRIDRKPVMDSPAPDAKELPGTGTMITVGLPASVARAIASAILSAATEAHS